MNTAPGVFTSESFDKHESVSFFSDAASGLRAIIAVHSSRLGPAVGGCRMYPYASEAQAIDDALRLSRGMTYKSALAGLPMGGGKAVIIGDPSTDKTPALLRAFGGSVDSLGGRYVTAEDSGTTVADMAIISERTRYVSGVKGSDRYGGDPSPYTAYGIFCGMQTALKARRKGQTNLDGCRVGIQGAGAVGRHLISLLIGAGAEVFVDDISERNLRHAEKLGAHPVAAGELFTLPLDILSPCALGGALTTEVVAELRCDIVAGAANNQLASPEVAVQLMEREILYTPDFAINAGGIIDVHYQRIGGDHRDIIRHIERIAVVLEQIFTRAKQLHQDTHSVAEAMAEELLNNGGQECSAERCSA